MRAAVLFAICVAVLQTVAPAPATLTVLYDNYPFADGCATGWGFSALIEGVGRTILFDAGADAAVFQRYVDALKVDLTKVDFVFISHDHGDHTGGLPLALRKKAGVSVYVAAFAQPEFKSSVGTQGGRVVSVTDSQAIAPGVLSTGDLGDAIHEQALILDTPQGLIVVTGCAHPGIVSILEKAREVGKKDIWMVLGGFHLGQTPAAGVEQIIARFKTLGVQHVGATHCTGDAAIGMFRKAYGASFVELGVGRRIDLGAR